MPALQIADLENAKTDVDHIADIANSEELTATDRLGREKPTLEGLRQQYPNAEPAAAEAAISAETATTQAGIATTQAGVATTQAGNAAASATTAASAAAAALAAGHIYADTTAGLAARASGEYFCVPATAGGNDFLILYLDNAGVAVEKGRFPSSTLVAYLYEQGTLLADDGVWTDYVGIASPGAGSATIGTGTFIFNKPIPRKGRLFQLDISVDTGNTVKIKRYTRSGNTYTWQSEISRIVTAGLVTFGPDALDALEVQPGDYIGLYAPASTLKYTTGAAGHEAQYTFAAGDNTTTATYSGTAGTNRPEVKISFYGINESLLDTQTTANKSAALWEETGATLTIGATTPGDKATTLAVGSVFFERLTNQEPGILEEYAVYSKVAGNALLIIVKPTGSGGYSLLHKQYFQLTAAGTKTLQRSDGSLPLVKVPRGCLVGVQALTASAITYDAASTTENGYLAYTGEPTGALTGQFTAAYGLQVQQRVKIAVASYKRKRDDAAPRYNICDLDVSVVGALPPASRSAGMSYSGGYAASSSTGLNGSYIEGLVSSNDNRTESTHELRATSAAAKITCGRRPRYGLSSVDEGTVAYFDIATNAIAICASWSGGATLPANATGGSKTCSFTIPQNVDLIGKLRNDRKVITFTLTNPLTGESDSISVDGGSVSAGLCYGVATSAVLAGTGSVKKIKHRSLVRDPVLAMIGTSITEGSGTTQANAWANLVADALDGRAIVAGDGGTTTDSMLRRLRDILIAYPSLRAIAWEGVTNEAALGASGVTAYQTNTALAKALCDSYSVEFIAVKGIPRNDANQTHVDTMNDWIDAQGYRKVSVDLRLSVGYDGSTWNTTLMNDSVHPNTAGHAAMADQFQIDQAWLFDWYGTDT